MINRSQAPSPSGNLDFKLPEIKVLKTINNFDVYFVKKEKLPIVFTNVTCDAGSKFDPIDKKGLAYLTSLVIDEGAGEFNALQLSDEFDKLGSIFSTYIGHDSNDFTLLSLKENFDYSFYLLSKVLTEPHLDQKDFDREKNKLINRILQLKDDASFVASSVFEKIVFKDTFYELPEIGLISTVSNINLDDVVKFYNEYIFLNHYKIFVVGNIEEDFLLTTIEKYLSKINPLQPKEISFTKNEKVNAKFYVVDKKESAQSEIIIGHTAKPRNADDYYPTKVMNAILGGQFSSRINLNLRENKGYTYGASSSFSYYKHSGLFAVHTAVNIENTADAIKEIFNELKGIQTNVKQEEVDFAKSYLIKEFPSKFETYSQVEKIIEQLIFHSLPLDEIKVYQAKIHNVKLDEVLLAANNNIQLDKLSIVVVGDLEKIIPQIKNQFNIEPAILDNEGNKI